MNKMFKIKLILLGTIFISTNVMAIKVYISQGARHPALDVTCQGIVDGLESVYHKDMDLKIEYAQGNIILAKQIASKFASQQPDIVVGIGTMASQAFMKLVKDSKLKLIFTSVTDPVGANLISHQEKNVSGVSNYISQDIQIELFKKIIPDLKSLGFIYNPSEVNSISLIDKLKKSSTKFGVKLVLQAVNQTSEVMQAATKISSKVDAIFVSTDATALSAISVIVKSAKSMKKPVFVGDIDLVKEGALAGLGPNQYDIGKQTANMIVRVLNEDTSIVPIEYPKTQELYLNKKVADELGIEFSKELIDKAVKIIN